MSRRGVEEKALPEGWREMKLEDIGEIVTGTTPSTRVREYYDNGVYPFITPTDINSRKNISASERYLSVKGLRKGRFIPKGSLLVTCIASIGKNAILDKDGSCNQQINAVLPSDHYNTDYLYYLIENNSKHLLQHAGKSATAILNKKTFSKLTLIVPPLPEQKAIASLLETWDTAIEKTEALIAAKEKRFKWLLKTLVSDQWDNPKWRKVKLGEVCLIDRETLSSKTPAGYCFQYISLSDIGKGKLIQTQKYKFAEAPSRARRIVKQGDVLLATVRPNLQGFYIFKEDVEDCIVSTGFAVLTAKRHLLDSEYLFQMLFSDRMLAVCHAANVGSNYPAINSSDVPRFEVSIPSLLEQKVIAKLLDTTQREIKILAEIAGKYHTQKLGLMQKLLIGKWKVK